MKDVKLGFYGAAQNVTGSCYLLDNGSSRILIDCGYYQERDLKGRNWEPFPFEPDSIDAVLLTHAHLDHCGLLPKLSKGGFKGTVFGTSATMDIAKIVMLDSAKIQEEDAKHKRRRHDKEGRKGPYPVESLFTHEDAEAAASHFQSIRYNEPVSVAEGLEASFHDAGHILGSSMIKLKFDVGGEQRSIVFSGDIGRWDTPILCDPSTFDDADYVVVESTYGNRQHKPNDTIPGSLAAVINETRAAGGHVVIPSFAIERTQELLYRLGELLTAGEIESIPVFVDSPMAIRVTEVFNRHPEFFDDDAKALIRSGHHPCDFPGLEMSRSVDESKAINQLKAPAVVIAGSGMCTGGRIKHHLVNNISRPESTVLFVGYQAVGTLGRTLLECADEVRIHGQKRPVRAKVKKINGFSAHADRDELFKWLSALKRAPMNVFVTHGEEDAANAFSDYIREKAGWSTLVPGYKDVVTLE